MAGPRALVTGGAGFIGSELVRQLTAAGAIVTVVDNLVNGRRENLDGLPEDRVELIVLDVRDTDRLERYLRRVSVVFHLACLGVRHSLHSPLENHEINATATLRLLQAAKGAGARRFVYVSSSEVYGTGRGLPMSEEHPVFPSTVYGASKLAGECYARAFHETYGYPTVVVRPFNTYGPRCHHEGDSGEVIPRFMLRCLAGRPMVIFGDGTQTRDFTYVSDTAQGILAAGFTDEAVGQILNLGSGREVTMNDLAREVANIARMPATPIMHDEPRPGDVRRLCADGTKARRLLGLEAQVPLGEGLARLRDWYLSMAASPESLLEHEVLHNWKAGWSESRGS